MFGQKEKIKTGIVFLLFLSAVLSWSAVLAQDSSNFWRVNFLDIGQGSAVFIASPGGRQVLVDGGPGGAILPKLGAKMPFYDKAIDVLILSHPDADHLAGLYAVLKNYQVDLVWQTCVKDNSTLYAQWQELLLQKGVPVHCARAGDTLMLGSGGRLQILYPFSDLTGQEFKDSNQSSIVLRLDIGQNSFLLTGDADKKVERGLAFYHMPMDVNFLQAGHHGSKTSTSELFLQTVKPQAAIIQAGQNNKYGHPHQSVLDLLEKYSIQVLRTDQAGDIDFVCGQQECFLQAD
ncbi:MAG: hypothetical protein COU85_02245 [Candidatus Portnoybacteria bacterium CG10_big_fil_rev_8_21_14_0_10_44_7]|uniref:Metallo-beta-lactamase domain-containing protein n=1 Tax=Candidatus Portnoybacteria bacterium CG10_big_fil_rev_8_21_14_0_10_44_7 TaxID=1974816 RepID=A0A2M8KIF9_9BACT|nr:MAG: hypothetical protein COU85_02245 [Candidatus Portnoybacteria bacterium CG10_big_fil_rev_8_21_14_0_10_44_7]